MRLARTTSAIVGAIVLGAGGALTIVAAPPAAAAPAIQVSPAGPYAGGETVQVTISGFTPDAAVIVALNPASRVPPTGPGDSCAPKLGCAKLLVADASGGLSTQLTIVNGPIENALAPAESCSIDAPCVIVAMNINDTSEIATADVTYSVPPPTSPPTTAPPTTSPALEPTLTYTPAGPVEGGDVVEVSISGFTPFDPVVVALVAADRFPFDGPGDVCPASRGCSNLLVVDDVGAAVATLTIVEGPMGNTAAPEERCDATNDCLIAASNINNPDEAVAEPVVFVGSGTPEPTSPGPTSSEPTSPDPTATEATAGESGRLAESGATTSGLMAVGLLLLVVGTGLLALKRTWWRTAGSAPHAH